MRKSLLFFVSAVLITACSQNNDAQNATPTISSPNTQVPVTTAVPSTAEVPSTTLVAPYVSEIYSDPAHWTCRPDMVDTCDDDTSITLINADGTREIQTFTPNPDAPVDCFYAYPTASEDATLNSDLIAGREKEVAFQQVARLSTICRIFAPTYRSVTLAGLFNPALPGDRATAWLTPFNDIEDAWKHYLANDNHGRGVILLSHSQGTGHLVRLLKEVIDPDQSQRDILLSAVMLGGAVAVPEGEVIGAAMQNIPLCSGENQVGCIITYASFRDTAPPPINAYFGHSGDMSQPAQVGQQAGCTNPASITGGMGSLRSAFPTASWAYSDPASSDPITTPFMAFPGLIDAQCVYENGFSYLKIHINADPTDSRTDNIKGDLSPEWGTHAVDWEIASISIQELLTKQIAAWSASHSVRG